MPAKKYRVRLTEPEREETARCSTSPESLKAERSRARVLLLADEGREGGCLTDAEIGARVGVNALTAGRVRQRFTERGLLCTLRRQEPRKCKGRRLDNVGEALLLALAASAPPAGCRRWSLHLLKHALIERHITDTISHETVRRALKRVNTDVL